MSLAKYLASFTQSSLHLIGPFFEGSELPAEPVVFVDRGANFRKTKYGFAVGDGDSSDVKMDELLNPKKDFSDLAYVLHNIPKQYTQIHLHGFLGYRRDHEIMNLAEVHTFLKQATNQTSVYFDQKVAAYSKGTWEMDIQGLFSLFSFEPINFKLKGNCEYKIPTSKTLKHLSSNGLSNHGDGKIEFVCDMPVFVYFSQ